MLDFFTIFTRGGVVLWCIKYTEVLFGPALNALIQSVILEEKTASKSFHFHDLCLEYRLDNQFELIFVVAYQKNLRLSYTDKFLDQIYLEFRDRYKNRLETHDMYKSSFDFDFRFKSTLQMCEKMYRIQEAAPRIMKTFEQSEKSKKSISSMIISKKNDPNFNKKELKKQEAKKKSVVQEPIIIENGENGQNGEMCEKPKESEIVGAVAEDVLQLNREKFIQKMTKKTEKMKNSKPKAINNVKKNVKQPRKWDLGGTASDAALLERKIEDDNPSPKTLNSRLNTEMIGQMKGNIKFMDEEEIEEEDGSDDEDRDDDDDKQEFVQANVKSKKSNGFFNSLKSLVGSKELVDKDLEPVLAKFCDHLVAKNVAIEVAQKLCDSLKQQLCGKTLGTFDTVRSTVKKSLHEALLQILSPKKRIDILRDCLKKKAEKKPYVITFCGVNGVGKSTNLAKIAFWLIENNLRILIAACDTFRSGAVEQLKTHVCHLNALYAKANVPVVELYQKGYGKDAAKIAFEAVKYASVSNFDVVLIDTAGRMHNKEHLMRDLANLIKLNEPDLVLFVGEALVGNVAVTQLIKFNEAIVDYAADSQNPKTIDGILLTKFDTVDDKVGAAISMTYISGQPIMFVGTGQNYTDLKALNPNVVVNALMK